MDLRAAGLFVASATALLGSPGPGIVALLAVGRVQGWRGGLRFYFGLQIGLAAAVLISGAGLFSILAAYPDVTRVMVIGATGYLVYLSFAIAFTPPGRATADRSPMHSPVAGLLLGITNPKAYLAIAALLASPLRLAVLQADNIMAKIALSIVVIILVDIAWLWIGVALGRTTLSARGERAMNLAMGATILIATLLAL
jgi:threonine/homoserine/homoserine lactone efflux protein